MKHQKQFAALLLSAVMAASCLTGCGASQGGSGIANKDLSAVETATGTTAVAETETSETEETTVATTVHVSPVETVSSTLGMEISEIDAMLNRDATNTYNASLQDFGLEEGDVIQSFTFVVYSEDGSSPLGNYKGGYGVSVSEDCASATDEGWYQSADFEQYVNSAYAEFTWNVPGEIQSEIDLGGEVMFGHWWSGVQTVRLASIVCTFSRTREVPVDGTNSTNPGVTLRHQSDSDKTVNLPLSDFIGEADIPQTVTYEISSGGSLGKFTGAFGVSVDEDADCATDEGWYQTQNVCVITDSSNLTLTWIIPDDVKDEINQSGDLMLGFWWSDQDSITLDSVSVRYSNSTGTTTKTKANTNNKGDDESGSGTVASVDVDTPSSEEVNAMTSAEIVEDIRVGWNLGNSLDSYDTGTSDTETGWGNPKTTRAMIEAVQDAGFNAVRIPVTWGEHMSDDGTIEDEWMARVKEVVDYAYDCGLYVILNVHHDDYIWLTPTNADYESDRAILTHIWEQIAAEFAEYDHRLIFEGMNEPRVVGSAEEWTGGTQESRDVINRLFQAFVDTVRAAGGQNEGRTLIVSSYAQSIEKDAVNAIVVPDDDHIIVSIHSYAPWDFCGDENDDADWGTDADRAQLDANFQFLADTFINKGVPVIIDEFGAVNKNNTSDRAAWYHYYISTAKSYGIKCFVWDNGTTDSSGFGLLDRENCTWFYPEIVESIMDAAD